MQDNNSLFSNTMRDLYKHFQVYTDTALAEKLGMKRTAIAQWRFKQTVPKKILTKYGHTITGTGEKVKTLDIPIEQGDSPVDANYIIELQKDKIEYLQKELAEKNALIKHKLKEKPETLDEISDLLNDASKQWSWVFYHTDKPMSCTRKGILRNVNPALCKLLGYTEDEMLGKSLLEFIHPDDHKRAIVEIKKSTRNIQLRICKSNGKYCNMNIEAQEFGVNGNVFSVGLITCCEKGCPDI